MTRILLNISAIGAFALLLASCTDKGHPGYEYAPNMYRSVPLDPMSQTAEAEYPHNPNNMTMREPVEGTVSRGNIPYTVPKDSLEMALKVTPPNGLLDGEATMAEGKELYDRFCTHCHGVEGDGQGLVGVKYKGVPKYSAILKGKTIGHVFHVITHGKGRMNSHATQLNPEERWKISEYVMTFQKKEEKEEVEAEEAN